MTLFVIRFLESFTDGNVYPIRLSPGDIITVDKTTMDKIVASGGLIEIVSVLEKTKESRIATVFRKKEMNND